MVVESVSRSGFDMIGRQHALNLSASVAITGCDWMLGGDRLQAGRKLHLLSDP
jgi:hypothetical protein